VVTIDILIYVVTVFGRNDNAIAVQIFYHHTFMDFLVIDVFHIIIHLTL